MASRDRRSRESTTHSSAKTATILAYTAQRVVQQTSSSQYVEILDGKEGPPLALVGSNAEGNGVLLSADGAHLAYPAKGSVGPTNRSPIVTHVVIDGKDIPYANRLWMSPDGKTIAYESLPPGGGSVARAVLVINGKPGLEYAAIQDVRFAPDGHVVYSVRAANSKFFVVDGEKEYGPYASVIWPASLTAPMRSTGRFPPARMATPSPFRRAKTQRRGSRGAE